MTLQLSSKSIELYNFELCTFSNVIIQNEMANDNSHCKNCLKRVRDNCRGVECDICRSWFHLKYKNLSLKDYKYFCNSVKQMIYGYV